MYKIDEIGGGFRHAYSTTWWKKPKYVEWVKDNTGEMSFYIDDAVVYGLEDNNNKKKFAWLNESRAIAANAFNFSIMNFKRLVDSYEVIFTSYKKMCKLDEKFVWVYPLSYWIEEPKLYEKIKIISMIASNKTVCKGHEYRKQWISKLKDKVDLYGNGYNPIKLKDEGLKDYMFSVAMENDSYETYFTEKILDCFATGTIPVYWGAPDIAEHFNMDGIILLNENFKVEDLSEDVYYSKLDAVKDNFERVINMDLPEDWIYKNYIKR